MKTINTSNINVKYSIECPYCGKDTDIEYDEIIGLTVLCSECLLVFRLKHGCEFEV